MGNNVWELSHIRSGNRPTMRKHSSVVGRTEQRANEAPGGNLAIAYQYIRGDIPV